MDEPLGGRTKGWIEIFNWFECFQANSKWYRKLDWIGLSLG